MESGDLTVLNRNEIFSDQYDSEFLERNRVVKIGEDAEFVKIAYIPEVTPEVAKERLRKHHSPKKVDFQPISSDDMAAILARISALGETKGRRLAGEFSETRLDEIANDAPIVNLVNSLILDALSSSASDIHIEVDDKSMLVRYRMDGSLRTVNTHPVNRFPAVSSRIKIMANLNIMETRRPQDGRITVTLGGREIFLRISIVPLVRGESIVLRIFNRDEGIDIPENLGFPPETIKGIRGLLRHPHGLILVTGPTGSGKTTTLSAFLSEIADPAKKVITLEDPVEYVLPGVDQIPVREDIGIGFSTLLRRVLRQDPDIIMVGEIRDSETAELAIRAALTGHLVLTTLHTNDAPSAIPRLIDMGLPSYLLAAVLRGVLAQRLVRKNCQSCTAPRNPTPEETELAENHEVRLDGIIESTGCERCGQTGFSGRTAISEWFDVDRSMAAAVRDSAAGIGDLPAVLDRRGFRPMAVDAFGKVALGITSIDEVTRTVQL